MVPPAARMRSCSFGSSAARLDMALGREEQRVAEAALQRRLELGKAGRIEPAVAFGHPRKALEIVALARVGDDERAVEGGVRQLAPPDVRGSAGRAWR